MCVWCVCVCVFVFRPPPCVCFQLLSRLEILAEKTSLLRTERGFLRGLGSRGLEFRGLGFKGLRI